MSSVYLLDYPLGRDTGCNSLWIIFIPQLHIGIRKNSIDFFWDLAQIAPMAQDGGKIFLEHCSSFLGYHKRF